MAIGEPASRLGTEGLTGFVNVLIIVDSGEVAEYSLKQIADYVAMLVLTRTSLDGCSELPSIIDILSADCADRAPPDAITEADISFLKALYAANLEMNLNLERGDIRDQMRGKRSKILRIRDSCNCGRAFSARCDGLAQGRIPNRRAVLARARCASMSRSRGSASDDARMSAWADAATSSTARSKAARLACEGLLNPLSFLTN